MNSQEPTGRREDRILVTRMLSGEQGAFDEFFEAHFPGLYRFALARVDQNADAAEEVVQAALSKALRTLETYRGEATLLSWLCTFCRHEIGALYRERGQSPSLTEDTAEIRAALDSLAASDRDDPESRLRGKQLSRLVQVTLDHLPRHYGDALEWKYIEGVSVAEIGARLAIGTKAAESLLTRARVAFRDGFAAMALQRPEGSR
jgi:RNA polymerase sigma-70 factor (ECF subfamily)